MHSNAVSYNAEFDQVMLSVLEFSEIWIIDHSTTTAEAAGHSGGRQGKGGDLLYRWGNPRAYRAGTTKDQRLFGQHNAHWIPKGLPGEGHVLVFNNGRRRIGGAYSSVDELVLPVDADGRYAHKPGEAFGPDQPIWSYAAPKRADFYAEFISGAHRLPNGNTFICSGPNGTIFEVTPEKDVVWKYVNPARPGPPTGGRLPQPVEFLPSFLRDTLHLTAEQTKQADEHEKEIETKLDVILTPEQNKQLKQPPTGSGPAGPEAVARAVQPVRILPGLLQQRLKPTDDQKKQLEALRQEAEGMLEKMLTADQRKQLKEIREGFVNNWGAAGPPALGNAVFRSYRYGANYPGLAGKELVPGKTIEELQAKAFQGK
jgi:hypothetical protein